MHELSASGERYRDTCYNDAWIAAEGLDVASQLGRLEIIVRDGRWID